MCIHINAVYLSEYHTSKVIKSYQSSSAITQGVWHETFRLV